MLCPYWAICILISVVKSIMEVFHSLEIYISIESTSWMNIISTAKQTLKFRLNGKVVICCSILNSNSHLKKDTELLLFTTVFHLKFTLSKRGKENYIKHYSEKHCKSNPRQKIQRTVYKTQHRYLKSKQCHSQHNSSELMCSGKVFRSYSSYGIQKYKFSDEVKRSFLVVRCSNLLHMCIYFSTACVDYLKCDSLNI